MPNCMTCRHNDRAAKYCSLKRAHTDLGYVLNCVAWAPTDEAEMRRLRDENRRLRKLVGDMVEWAYIDSSCDLQEQFADEMRELGVHDG